MIFCLLSRNPFFEGTASLHCVVPVFWCCEGFSWNIYGNTRGLCNFKNRLNLSQIDGLDNYLFTIGWNRISYSTICKYYRVYYRGYYRRYNLYVYMLEYTPVHFCSINYTAVVIQGILTCFNRHKAALSLVIPGCGIGIPYHSSIMLKDLTNIFRLYVYSRAV